MNPNDINAIKAEKYDEIRNMTEMYIKMTPGGTGELEPVILGKVFCQQLLFILED